MEEAPKKKRGLLRRSVGAVGRGSSKVIGTTAKVTVKGTGKVAKATAKSTGKVAKFTAKGGYYTMKNGGKGLLIAAGMAFPRHSDESIWQYRKRMAILGFKVSWVTGGIISAASGSSTVQQFAINYARDAVMEEVVKRGIGEIFNTDDTEESVE